MATLRMREIKSMGKDEREKKIRELKIEMIKAKSSSSKKGGMKVKEIKKIMARLYSTNK